MKPILIDSSILIDIFTDDPEWATWSRNQLTELSGKARLFINPIVYAELSIGFKRIEELEECLAILPIEYKEVPKEALFLAGKAFLRYRKAGGNKASPLPDFFVGAHAAIKDWSVITRDNKRMAYYFPSLEIVYPS